MKRHAFLSAQQAGFSLVELLVSLVILGMVGALLASGLRLGQRVWGRSEERAQAAREMFDAQAALRRLFDDMQPLRSGSQDARIIEFRGGADDIEGVVPLPGIGLGGLYRLHLFWKRSERRLDLDFQAYERGGAAGANEANLTTIASEIDSMELRYFGKALGEETPEWHREWRGQEELPALISIKINSARDVAWPELLIAPRVKAVDWR
jgi:prepilin-type N-terminal cleavage/methylation domain-containing protein